MPIDEFKCTQCRGVFVRMDPPGASTSGVCPACQGLAWRRLRIHCRSWQARNLGQRRKIAGAPKSGKAAEKTGQ